jgi:GAF domain-containing protein
MVVRWQLSFVPKAGESMNDPKRMAEVFVELADTVLDTFDIIEFLDNLTERSVELLNADAAGLVLVDQGRLNLLAATVQQVRTLGLFELQVQEGPCLDCVRTGEAIINVPLAGSQDRWPKFAPAALESGFEASHALPMKLRGQVIGALNLFTRNQDQLTVTDLAIGQAMADMATIGLLHQRNAHDQTALTERLEIALNSRVLVEQAKGALAARANITLNEAFDRIRRHARHHHLTLASVAMEVVDGGNARDVLFSA